MRAPPKGGRQKTCVSLFVGCDHGGSQGTGVLLPRKGPPPGLRSTKDRTRQGSNQTKGRIKASLFFMFLIGFVMEARNHFFSQCGSVLFLPKYGFSAFFFCVLFLWFFSLNVLGQQSFFICSLKDRPGWLYHLHKD